MYKYKIWDKKEPINGVPAERVLENNYSLQADDVVLIYKEINPYQILYIERAHGPIYQLDDTIDMSAERYCEKLTQDMLNPSEFSIETTGFTPEQIEIIQRMIQAQTSPQ